MKALQKDIQKEIVFYVSKLPRLKQVEALDFIKWLWGGSSQEKEFTSEEISKLEVLAQKKSGKKFNNWENAKKYLEGLMH
ncbi:hypothetical protein A2291_04060 [candidate division WOR-1 bacterium RIFOXYB2_FULL_42_35]|uniref:DUF2281 domain-containing protein n=1 Tax=candidate division WOR-1 bacterium RIFOXYC2_FULL_41_25 TaxID=1802586 RepID=A0A1F4TN27_UNCSA|nr:MAG: hypothetical protein A2247_00900 [candidate division WOR-1 bacterium RIFOXYA2_FULL_41_14]OGC24305.1 MAG: hypothetical protein A2291_04060 [candidate division WOR-1 bacterium RIFOXYB2_FULL_42_35]OGC34007.1 MAG: hypothetical protein A2462_01465 [candidate division WOR-1 bacterium RIFOXYC2_FULL_41_25]OGC43125.1 MAG: hypothetical protein A2548_04375 [candidate division WOR-1 bacterium RIFOXYD2_FULL_41_8]